MILDIAKIKQDYEESKGNREIKKWIFALATFGLGGLYLWSTTSVVKEGQIGLRSNAQGEQILLPPGRHSNFPWESYPVDPQSLADKVINLGPYKIISVETGFVAKTINRGTLEILSVGQHLLNDASHVFDGLIPIKQETKKLHQVKAYTSDNVGLTLQADVRYQIEEPEKAIRQINNIETSITEIAEISISQIVGHHNLADFSPATTSIGTDKKHGMGEVILELATRIKEQLLTLGIKLINIGITSWTINDKSLAHELAQGAVNQSQTQSKMISADRDAKIKELTATADAKATVIRAKAEGEATGIRAEAEAKAVELRGAAIKKIAGQFEDDPIAHDIYSRSQQVELVERAENPHLFFTQQTLGSNAVAPQFSIPLQPAV